MRFIETLKYTNNKLQNFDLHLNRVKKTLSFFGYKIDENEWSEKNILNKIITDEKTLRVRIIYSNKIEKIETFPIKQRSFKKFKVVHSNINYYFKYENRAKLNSLKTYDDIIIIKNNLVTDTTISNLAFFTGKEWLTPKYPLLKGTKREELLSKNILKEANIHKYDLKYFKKIAMINAILGFFIIDDFDIIY